MAIFGKHEKEINFVAFQQDGVGSASGKGKHVGTEPTQAEEGTEKGEPIKPVPKRPYSAAQEPKNAANGLAKVTQKAMGRRDFVTKLNTLNRTSGGTGTKPLHYDTRAGTYCLRSRKLMPTIQVQEGNDPMAWVTTETKKGKIEITIKDLNGNQRTLVLPKKYEGRVADIRFRPPTIGEKAKGYHAVAFISVRRERIEYRNYKTVEYRAVIAEKAFYIK